MTRLFLHAAGWLLPREQRAEWIREWEAELWHAFRTGFPPRDWRRGALADAACLGLTREALAARFHAAARSPAFCFFSLFALLAIIAAASRGLPATRTVFLPLPYADAGRIATISRGAGSLSMRGEIPREWVRLWAKKSNTLEAIAAYAWKSEAYRGGRILTATISSNFFPLLGITVPPCRRCVYVAARLQRRADEVITLDGVRYLIAGVLPPNFWFLSHDIAVWRIDPAAVDKLSGVVVRLRPDATPHSAESELRWLLQEAGYGGWDSFPDVSLLQERVRSPLGSFSLAFFLALFATVLGSHPRLQNVDVFSMEAWRRGAFFLLKSALLLAAVLLAGLEFTAACSITMIGGTDLLAEPLSTWLFLIGCMTALTWSVHDQRMRCRVCLRRLGLAAHVGCPGSLLLSWAGTEMVCISGHGMLHVPEMPSCWLEPEHWTALDASWRELFAPHG